MNREYAIRIKSATEIAIIREAGTILSVIFKELKRSLTIGMKTKDLDQVAEDLIRQHHVTPAFKGYRGYPACLCISINEEVVHGIPGPRKIEQGDIVSLDLGIIYKDFYADMAFSMGMGEINDAKKKLLEVTSKALLEGIDKASPGNHLSDISHAIQSYVERNRYSVVREFVGHGIGRQLHEDPEIPNFGEPHKGPILSEGMVFCIEPMVNIGHWRTRILEDGWTVVTDDLTPSAHFEHMIVITQNGPEILTEW